jgi:hypothetical protein
MLKDTDIVSVQNKVNATVVYQIPDLNNLIREFRPGEIKKVPMDELRRLSYDNGGRVTLQQYLFIDNKEAVDELLGETAPEYFYTQDDIKTLLVSGSIEQFEDFLNFAPAGLKDTMKDMAVDIKVNNVKKRELIKEYLGLDVSKAIELLDSDEEDKNSSSNLIKSDTRQRKAEPIHKESNSETKTRKYNVVNK